MSTVVSPVTQTAETLVNAAVSTGGRVGPGVEIGNDSSTVPTRTAARNASGTILAGCVTPGRIVVLTHRFSQHQLRLRRPVDAVEYRIGP